MKLRGLIIILVMFTSIPAQACMMSEYPPSRDDLRALQTLSERITKETEIKSQIDASVWGIFLDAPSDSLKEKGYARFKIGGVSKGHLSEVIHVVSDRRDVTLGTEIQKLNLRKIDKSRWTDIGVTQQDLNWGAEACEIAPTSPKCDLHQIEQHQFKALCQPFIWEVYSGCLHLKVVPKLCWKYRDEAIEEPLRIRQ
jgi:hypothetical protein